jgi:hypothetical protein
MESHMIQAIYHQPEQQSQGSMLFIYIFAAVFFVYYSSHRSIISKRRMDIPFL